MTSGGAPDKQKHIVRYESVSTYLDYALNLEGSKTPVELANGTKR